MYNNKVSIIVPVYNSEAYLPMCIESILYQTYQNLEVLLIDDGSQDDSLKICREYALKDPRIVVLHQENKGVSAARNFGLENMNGDYFAFVDSDDEITPNAIEFLMQDVLKYKADMASAVKTIVYSNGGRSCVFDDRALHVYSGLDMLNLSLDGDRQTNSACAKIFKYQTFSKMRFVEGRRINEDGFYLFQCYTLRPKVVQHNESIYLYYIRENSNSRSAFSDKYFDMLYFCDRKKEIIFQQFPELSEKLITMEVSTNLFFLDVLCRTKEKKYRVFQKRSIKLVKSYYSRFYSINKHERQVAWIVAHGLYPLYKAFIRLKYYR
jgi:glycosyltransferase involved in cell wall biosynthesis